MTQETTTRALYNGDCPVCSAEMCHYEAYADRSDLPVEFDDLTKIDLAKWGVTEDEATRLLHVLHNGHLYVGFDAFLVLWKQMPKYAWLAKLGRLPLIHGLLSWGYTHIVARWIYNRHQRRKRLGLV